MDSRFSRHSPEFVAPATEHAYRQWAHVETARYVQRIVLAGSAAALLLAINDFLLLAPGSLFLVAVPAVRLAIFILGLIVVLIHARSRDYRVLDSGLFAWMLAIVVLNVLATVSRPAGFLLHVLVNQTTILGTFLFVPLRYPHRLICGFGGAATYLGALAATRPLSPAELSPLLLAILIAVVIGSIAAFRLERLRRLEFSNLAQARETNQRLIEEIEERRRLAAIVEESERSLTRLFEVSPIPLLLSHMDGGRLVKANRAAHDLLRLQPASVGAVQVEDFYADVADHAAVRAMLDHYGQVDALELRGRAGDGASFWLAVSARIVVYNEQLCILACWYDISARRQTEAALRQAKQSAEEASQAKSRFLAMVSHEIRTPMNGVLGLLQLVRNMPLDPLQRRYLATAHDSAAALIALLDGIVELIQLEGVSPILVVADFDLRRELASAVDLLRARAEEKGLTLSLSVAAPESPILRGDALRLRQVLLNLLSNAIKFTARGTISVDVAAALSTDRDGIDLRVCVADTGIGIAPEWREKIFEEFKQVDLSASRRHGGVGLGLAICRKLVALMGGSIAVDSRVNVGSAFRFQVPFDRGTAVAAVDAAAAEPAAPSLKILLVEDDPVNQLVAVGLLEAGGHAITVVDRGPAALAAVAGAVFDVVLLDLHLPELDGFETAMRIRQSDDAAVAALPILALTADVTALSRQRCAEVGIDAVLAKPILQATLDAALNDIRKGAQPSVSTLGPIRVPSGAESVDRNYVLEQLEALGPQRVIRLVRLFRRTARCVMRQLSEAVAVGDRRHVAALAHRLRASTAALGFVRLQAMATQIEMQAARIDSTDLTLLAQNWQHTQRGSVRTLLALLRDRRSYVFYRHAELVADVGDRNDDGLIAS